MKFNLKTIAIAAAMVASAGTANAAIVSDFTGDGTLVLQAFNETTRAYYIRDLGFAMSQFLPAALTPEAGVNLNAGNTANFGDASGWATWIAGQTLSAIKWNVTAVDNITPNRGIASSANPFETATAGDLQNFVSGSYAGTVEGYSLAATGGTPGLSFTNTTGADGNLDINWGLGTDGLGVLGGSAFLYFFDSVNNGKYANSLNSALVALDALGNFSYTLAPAEVTAVPVPAAAWLLAAGLMGLGGAARRRKANEAA